MPKHSMGSDQRYKQIEAFIESVFNHYFATKTNQRAAERKKDGNKRR